MMPGKKKYSKSDLILHLSDAAQSLIELIMNTSKDNKAALSDRLKNVKIDYVGTGTWWDLIVTPFRWRGPELDSLIKILENETDELIRLQKFRDFIQKGGWTTTSANTQLFKQIIAEVSVDFSDNDLHIQKFVIKTLRKEMVNTIDAKEAAYMRILKEAEIERKALEDQNAEVARLKTGIIISDDLKTVQNHANKESETPIYYLRKGNVVQFYWVAPNLKQHRLIHSGLKPFYCKDAFTEKALSTKEFNTLKEILLASVCDIKKSLSKMPPSSESVSSSSKSITTESSSHDSARESKGEEVEVHKRLSNEVLKKLQYALEIKHQIKSPSKSSAEVKNKSMPEPSRLELKYSPAFFETLEAHFSKEKKRPNPAELAGIATGPDGSPIGKIAIPESVARCFEKRLSKQQKGDNSSASVSIATGPDGIPIRKVDIPKSVALCFEERLSKQQKGESPAASAGIVIGPEGVPIGKVGRHESIAQFFKERLSKSSAGSATDPEDLPVVNVMGSHSMS